MGAVTPTGGPGSVLPKGQPKSPEVPSTQTRIGKLEHEILTPGISILDNTGKVVKIPKPLPSSRPGTQPPTLPPISTSQKKTPPPIPPPSQPLHSLPQKSGTKPSTHAPEQKQKKPLPPPIPPESRKSEEESQIESRLQGSLIKQAIETPLQRFKTSETGKPIKEKK